MLPPALACRAMFAGKLSTGAIVSATVTLNEPVVALPASSTARQVTLLLPMPNVPPGRGVHVAVTMPSTASLAVTLKFATAPAALLASTESAGGRFMAGPTESRTTTLNADDVVLPALSVARHVTVVVAMPNIDPGRIEHTGSTLPSTLSAADTAKFTAVPFLLVASAVWFDGMFSAGAVVSTTVTRNESVVVLPASSVARHVTVFVPSGNVAPALGSHTGVIAPSTPSSAVGLKPNGAPFEPVASTV